MLPYSENDICIIYRNAKDKKQQLQILADMNLTGTKEIADIVVSDNNSDGIVEAIEKFILN